MEELKQLREDEETTLDVVLSREHGCTKQLLEAEQILHSLLQEDQRLASVWGMWGEVLALLGNREKAAEAMLTSLEWSEVNSFESVSRYPVVIWGVCYRVSPYARQWSMVGALSNKEGNHKWSLLYTIELILERQLLQIVHVHGADTPALVGRRAGSSALEEVHVPRKGLAVQLLLER